MGWYADALKDGHYLDEERDRELLAEFGRVADELAREHGGADAFFMHGGLHLSACRHALAQATGRNVDGEVWSPEQVRSVYESADWRVPANEDGRMGYWNAKSLLELCCAFGLGLELNL